MRRSSMTKESSLEARIYRLVPSLPRYIREVINAFTYKESEEIETAATTISAKPVLLINPSFAAKYCRSDDHLLMLILHEAFHVILGHTRLFGKTSTPLDNLVFDAVVNASLCHMFPEDRYTSFFKKINPSSQMPSCLLRPIAYDTPKEALAVLERLYDSESFASVTYEEIYELIKRHSGVKKKWGDYTLLGDHEKGDSSIGKEGKKKGQKAGTEGEEEEGISSEMSEFAKELSEAFSNGSSGKGANPLWRYIYAKNIDRDIIKTLRELLVAASVIPSEKKYKGNSYVTTYADSYVYDTHDRRAATKLDMGGFFLPSYQKDATMISRREKEQKKAIVYLDVSGSQNPELPVTLPLLATLMKEGRCVVYEFSTMVALADPDDLSQGKFVSTGGTDFNCIFEHYFSLPGPSKKLVILTDGFAYFVNPKYYEMVKQKHVELYVGYTKNHDDKFLKGITHKSVVLGERK